MGVIQQGTDLLPGPIDGEYKNVPLGTSPSSHPVDRLVSFSRPVEALAMQGGNVCAHGEKDPKGREGS